MMASRYAHAKQFRRHHRQLRLLRRRLGRIICDIRRKFTGRPELEAVFEAPISRRSDRNSSASVDGSSIPSTPPRSNASSMKGCGSPGCRRAEVRSGSNSEELSTSICFPRCPQTRTLLDTFGRASKFGSKKNPSRRYRVFFEVRAELAWVARSISGGGCCSPAIAHQTLT